MAGYFTCTGLSHMTSKLLSYTYLMLQYIYIYRVFHDFRAQLQEVIS